MVSETSKGSRDTAATPPPDATQQASLPKVWPWFVVSLLLLSVFGFTFYRYADEWLRGYPKVPRCAFKAERALRRPVLESGTEPHTTLTGETVYLSEGEDRAVRCAFGVEERLAREFATAFTETNPERRAEALLSIPREKIPKTKEHDLAAAVSYHLVQGALSALPDGNLRAKSTEVASLRACRFRGEGTCAARPYPPALAIATGGLGVPGLLFAIGLSIRNALIRLRLRRKRTTQAPGKTD